MVAVPAVRSPLKSSQCDFFTIAQPDRTHCALRNWSHLDIHLTSRALPAEPVSVPAAVLALV